MDPGARGTDDFDAGFFRPNRGRASLIFFYSFVRNWSVFRRIVGGRRSCRYGWFDDEPWPRIVVGLLQALLSWSTLCKQLIGKLELSYRYSVDVVLLPGIVALLR